MINMLGNEILRQRLALGLTIGELSKLTNVPVSTISNLENGNRKIVTKNTLTKLNKVLNLKEEYALGNTNLKLAQLLRLKREEKGLSQTDLAIMLGYNRSAYINQLENGRFSKINYSTFLKLQSILDLDYEEFKDYIIPILEKNGRQIKPNRELLQKLVKEKRNFPIKKFSKMVQISPATIVRIEAHPEKEVRMDTIVKLIQFLEFTKEEIMSCFETDDEEIISIFQKRNDHYVR